jgi:large subunit ribosomal protein L11e
VEAPQQQARWFIVVLIVWTPGSGKDGSPRSCRQLSFSVLRPCLAALLNWAVMHAGMDFYVVLDRAGYRVAKRRQRLAKVGVQHRVTKEDAIKWFQTKFEGIVHNKQSYN